MAKSSFLLSSSFPFSSDEIDSLFTSAYLSYANKMKASLFEPASAKNDNNNNTEPSKKKQKIRIPTKEVVKKNKRKKQRESTKTNRVEKLSKRMVCYKYLYRK